MCVVVLIMIQEVSRTCAFGLNIRDDDAHIAIVLHLKQTANFIIILVLAVVGFRRKERDVFKTLTKERIGKRTIIPRFLAQIFKSEILPLTCTQHNCEYHKEAPKIKK